MGHAAIAEVVRQHVVIEEWLSGADGAGFDSFVAALADEFEIVTPNGRPSPSPRWSRGSRATVPAAGVKIEVRSARVLAATTISSSVRAPRNGSPIERTRTDKHVDRGVRAT